MQALSWQKVVWELVPKGSKQLYAFYLGPSSGYHIRTLDIYHEATWSLWGIR